MRFPALVTVTLGLINLTVLYLIAKHADGDLSYVNLMLFIALIMGIGQSYFLGGLYFSKFYEGTKQMVWTNFVKIFLTLFIVTGICFLITPYIFELHNILSLAIIGFVSLVLLVISLKITLNKKQLDAIFELVYKK